MSRKFHIDRNPYDLDKPLYKTSDIEIHTGVTVLVGCNGSGKTTLLQMLKRQLKDANMRVLSYDNLHDGGGYSISRNLWKGTDTCSLATLATSSEGETIMWNLGDVAQEIGTVVRGQLLKSDQNEQIFARLAGEEYVPPSDDEIWLLLDSSDSGLSIDNVLDLKAFFRMVLDDCKKDCYIVVAANEYEMCDGENCFDVQSGEYIRFKDYEDYKKMILKSRKNKDSGRKGKR